MAYYVTNLGSNAANTSQVTFTGAIPPDAKTGDLLLMCVTAQNFLTDIIVNTAGWTKLGQPANGNGSNAIFWKIFDGSEETVEVTSTGGTAQRWGTVISVYRDVDQASPIIDHGGAVDVGNSITCASLTPANEDDLFVTTMVGGTSLEYKPLAQTSVPYPYELFANAGYRWTRTIVLFLSSGLYDTQATGSSFVLGHNNDGPSAYSVILKNASGGQTVAPMSIDYSLNRVFGDYCVDSAEEANDTWVDGSGIVSTIDGSTVFTESNQINAGGNAQYSNNENPTSVCNTTMFTPTTTVWGDWSLWYQPITADLTGKVLLLEGSESNANRASEVGLILLDSNDNWSVYTLKGEVRGDQNPVVGGGITLAISASTTPRYSSATPCDVTDITKIGTVSRASGTPPDEIDPPEPPTGSGSWTPAQLTSSYWWDASDTGTITDAAGSVSSWQDKNQSASITQGNASNQPTTGTTTINSLNTIDFDGSTSKMIYTGPQLSEYTKIIVFSLDVAPANNRNNLLSGVTSGPSGGTGGADALYQYATGSYRIQQDGVLPYGSTSVNTSTPTIIGATADATGSDLYINGNLESLTIPVTGPVARGGPVDGSGFSLTGDWEIGSFFGGGNLNGQLAEIIVVPSAVSTSDRQKLEGYLAHKWGTVAELPVSHPYKNSAPTV